MEKNYFEQQFIITRPQTTSRQLVEEKQIIPIFKNNKTFDTKISIQNNGLSNLKKMLIVDFETDEIKNVFLSNQVGAKTIKIREDLYQDLKNIKTILNSYGVPFSCQSINVSIDNNNVSDLGRVGLEIMLNPYAAMTETKNPEFSDYYIEKNILNKNKLTVYANCLKTFSLNKLKYKPQKKILDVYDIRETYNKYKPKTIKIFKNLLNLSQILEDHGFIQKPPQQEFFLKSDNIKSNWYIFYKPSKINVGYTYKELLLTVYDDNNEPIWSFPDKVWDGYKFNGNK